MIKAEIIADSINPMGNRITTYILTFPRFILAELNTHRVFSKNSASSRAIPFKTMLEKVETDPFIPIAWQKDHKGMQGSEYITDEYNLKICIEDWLEARNNAVKSANDLSKGFNKKDQGGNWIATEPKDFVDRVTKQLCNRLLEPFMWHTVILTGTEFDNFFELRSPQYRYNGSDIFRSKKEMIKYYPELESYSEIDWLKINHGEGEIHIMALAEAMWDAMDESTPKELQAGEWHIPFGDKFDRDRLSDLEDSINHQDQSKWELSIKIATARCARVSYLNFEGKDDYEADVKLFNRLKDLNHWSPFEHCARAMSEKEFFSYIKSEACSVDDTNLVIDDIIYLQRSFQENNFGWCRNYRGFVQLRAEMDKM